MATELYWPHDRMFRDTQNREEYVGEGTHEVPDDAVDRFLDRGWQLPADAEEIDADADQDTDELDVLLDGTVDDVESEIAAGDYDDQLDEIEDRADRAGVRDAVADRRDELEG